MIRFLLLDLDDTILDFHQSEYYAIRKTLRAFDIEPTDPVCELYTKINLAHWKALERKEITREQLEVSRFEQLFEQLNVCRDAAACGKLYYENLSSVHYFLPGAEAAVKRLSQKYELYMVTNGTAKVQHLRIASAGIGHLFRDIFISQEMGADKPDVRFFANAFSRIPGFDPAQAMIVGDSISSDIRGGKNMGIQTCWVNPKKKLPPEHTVPDHQIEDITRLEALLEKL